MNQDKHDCFPNPERDEPSSDNELSRKEFIKKVVKAAAVSGALIAAPQVLDKFLVPPVYAAGSRMSAPGSSSDQPSGLGTDTSIVKPTA